MGEAHQIVQADMVIFREPYRQLQRKRAFSPLIFGVEGLVTQEKPGNLPLGQVSVLPQIPNPQIHVASPFLEYPKTNYSVDFLDKLS